MHCRWQPLASQSTHAAAIACAFVVHHARDFDGHAFHRARLMPHPAPTEVSSFHPLVGGAGPSTSGPTRPTTRHASAAPRGCRRAHGRPPRRHRGMTMHLRLASEQREPSCPATRSFPLHRVRLTASTPCPRLRASKPRLSSTPDHSDRRVTADPRTRTPVLHAYDDRG